MSRSAYYGFTGHETATTVASSSVTYHETRVFEILPDGRVRLDSGGWRTATTKKRINQAARHFGRRFSVYAKNGDWYVSTKNGDVPFSDSMIIEG